MYEYPLDATTKSYGATARPVGPRGHRLGCTQRSWSISASHSFAPFVFLSQRSTARGNVRPRPCSPTSTQPPSSETVAAEDPSALFPLLSAFSLTERPSTPQQAHSTVFTIAANHIHSAALTSARVRLALHAATPRLAASAEYYDRHVANLSDGHKLHSPECASWVDWYGQVVCDAETLLQLANVEDDGIIPTKPMRLPLDHVHRVPPSLEKPRYTAIHFANPAAPSFHSLHNALLSLEPQVEYVLRWAQGAIEHEKGELSSHLSGYGVSLDLKKMDYLVLDDRNQHQAHAVAQDSGERVGSGDGYSDEEILTCIFDSLPYIDEEVEIKAMAGEPLASEEIAGLFRVLQSAKREALRFFHRSRYKSSSIYYVVLRQASHRIFTRSPLLG